MGEGRGTYMVLVGKPKSDNLENLGTDRKITFK